MFETNSLEKPLDVLSEEKNLGSKTMAGVVRGIKLDVSKERGYMLWK